MFLGDLEVRWSLARRSPPGGGEPGPRNGLDPCGIGGGQIAPHAGNKDDPHPARCQSPLEIGLYLQTRSILRIGGEQVNQLVSIYSCHSRNVRLLSESKMTTGDAND